MPDWAVTVLVGLASGLVGTILSTVLRISHERANDLRTRMLDAADDFVTAAVTAKEALIVLDNSISFYTIFEMALTPDNDIADKAIGNARTTVTAAGDRLPRLRLLYGPTSSAALRAEALKGAMGEWADHQRSMIDHLRAGEFVEVDKKTHPRKGAHASFDTRINEFSATARKQIVGRFNRGS